MLGSLILYLKGMRIVMFQLSGFYYRRTLSITEALRPFYSSLSPKRQPQTLDRLPRMGGEPKGVQQKALNLKP